MIPSKKTIAHTQRKTTNPRNKEEKKIGECGR
jgi:hypothetical protein